MRLPDGLTASNFQLTDRAGSHAFDVSAINGGKLRVLCYSPGIEAIDGHSGALMTLDITAADDFMGDATIRLQGTMFTTASGVEVPFDDETCAVTLPASILIGDVNGDGLVGIADVTDLIDYILGFELDGFAVEAADVSGDGIIGIADVTDLIDMILLGGGN